MIPLFKPYMPELKKIEEILYSGKLTSGFYRNGFEHKLKDFFRTDRYITANTFSNAIYVTLTALGIGAGDEIIASPMACLVSTQPYLTMGIKIIWADVDPLTGTLDPDNVRKKITPKTKAIVHNHFCGYPGYLSEINSIGYEKGIFIINDCIEAFGSESDDKLIGLDGADASVFSFGPVRIPNTIDGGGVIFKDHDIYKKSILIRDCGIDRTLFRDELGEINPECDINLKGYSAMMNEVNAYIGFCQMDVTNKLLNAQRKNALIWDSFLLENAIGIPIARKNTKPNYWIYGMRVKNKRKTIETFRDQGYYASGVHVNNNIYSVFGDDSYLSGVVEFNNSFVAVPCGWWLNSDG
ncbi:DegT/DnrJ/EryC1/StrS aminotransferase family protein [Ihubacter massiliensis]|uniref:DegT/DnrJ/EryC1/StrS aminotransferase family protein n=1 Tax=Hominibacterium faecale TaxID=2839743 RepID=A0A9J6QY45_9FIRM|nr:MULTISPECIES: DegT/DnrJ/EryC1/StrS aminotransferase family protein [Eubacteriales Family XIII. Incertae Sedis]MCO7123754.1 DegT/DnrJ/EryC1/StrS aminotransferase family protein [Ihubacter massiliensis]MCU7380409.1 DegT/DnrJ/EryC1/StrS aminotransferase family protein [Hominibacterium faecale]